LSRCRQRCQPLKKCEAAATAVRHVSIAAARSARCVLAEVRWRWTLKVLSTERWCRRRRAWKNFCAGLDSGTATSCARAVAWAGANPRPDCSSIARAGGSARLQEPGPPRCMVASRRCSGSGQKHTCRGACASASAPCACFARTGPAHREPRPQRRRPAIGNIRPSIFR
jgi:hypothetical protein